MKKPGIIELHEMLKNKEVTSAELVMLMNYKKNVMRLLLLWMMQIVIFIKIHI